MVCVIDGEMWAIGAQTDFGYTNLFLQLKAEHASVPRLGGMKLLTAGEMTRPDTFIVEESEDGRKEYGVSRAGTDEKRENYAFRPCFVPVIPGENGETDFVDTPHA